MGKLPEFLEEVTPEGEGPDKKLDPGWYDYAGGLRFWDGQEWTSYYAPPQPEPINYSKLGSSVCAGVLAAWFFIWLGAQIAPDVFYWPVKFVVEELPEGF
jgi:hypothetical protein